MQTDGVRVRQIVTNGLTNAVKYGAPTKFEPIRVVARAAAAAAARQSGAGDRHDHDDLQPSSLTVEVIDCGPGLCGQTEDAMFADFAAHVPATRTGAVGSSGLGLAICNRMARLLGGELHVMDRIDGASGTRFVLTLPLTAAEPERASRRQSERAPGPSIAEASGPAEADTGDTVPELLLHQDGPTEMTIASMSPQPPQRKRPPGASVRPELLLPLQHGTVTAAALNFVGAGPRGTAAPGPGHSLDQPPPLGLHVLAVDDSVGNRRVCARMLATLGCTCVLAGDGDEVCLVWQLLRTGPPAWSVCACARCTRVCVVGLPRYLLAAARPVRCRPRSQRRRPIGVPHST